MNDQTFWQEEVTEQTRPVSPYADSPYEVYYKPQTAPRKKTGVGKAIVCILVVLALLLTSNLVTAFMVSKYWNEQTELLGEAFDNKFNVLQQQITQLPESVESVVAPLPVTTNMTPNQIYEKNVRAVVAISCSLSNDGYYQSYDSLGSGFIYTTDGYVATNYHVVQGATSIVVTTYDEQEYPAQIVGYDAETDVAVLKMEGTFPCVELGSSDALEVGDQVVAIGNALGEMVNTLTVGYVSAKDKMISTDGTSINMLQTDAAINSGNSGGPLFNTYGQVVGITTAKYSGNTSSGTTIEGMGFAIPMDDIVGILEDLRDHGYVTGTYLGIYCLDVTAAEQAKGIPAGVYVESTIAGYVAEEAGIRAGDIITNVGGYDVESVAELKRVLRRFEAGDTTTVILSRGGEEIYLSVVLDAAPIEDPEPEQAQTPSEPSWYEYYFGDYFG